MFLKKPRKDGKGSANVRQMLDYVVGENNIETFLRLVFKFVEAIDNIQAQFFAAEFSARP